MKNSNSDASSSQQESPQTGQRWLEPRSMIVGGLAVAAIGVVFNWSWIVAVGVAPLLFTLPCMIMMGWMMWSMRPQENRESATHQEPIAQTTDPQRAAPLGTLSSQSNEDSNHA